MLGVSKQAAQHKYGPVLAEVLGNLESGVPGAERARLKG